MSDWTAAFQAANSITGDERLGARLANLAITAQVAAIDGLISPGVLSDDTLPRAIEDVGLEPLALPRGSRAAWQELARTSERAAHAFRSEGHDPWVQAFQASDPHQKSQGAYATPAPLADQLASKGLERLQQSTRGNSLRIIDPSAGCGGLLLAALRRLVRECRSAKQRRAALLSLHGVEIDPLARELCCQILWLVGSPGTGVGLHEVGERVIQGNALLLDWWSGKEPFDLVLMNPPWESLRHKASFELLQEARQAVVDRLAAPQPGARGLPSLYTAQGRGDRNLFKMFVELAPHLLREGGRLALLLPAAFGSDLGMEELRRLYLEVVRIEQWTTYENLERYFPIDARYKFGILSGERNRHGTTAVRVRAFATSASEVNEAHITLSRSELVRLGGPSAMLLELTSRKEVDILSRMLGRGFPFFALGPLGHVRYEREYDLTLDRKRGAFAHIRDHQVHAVTQQGEFRLDEGGVAVPLVEGRMVSAYDFFQKSWLSGSGRTARWRLNETRRLEACTPQYLITPRSRPSSARLALCDVTSATNTRTVHAALVPPTWSCGNTAPVLRFISSEVALAGCAILNSMVFDWLARRIVSGLHLNKFYLSALAWPALSEEDLAVLARAAAQLHAANPRSVALDWEILGQLMEGESWDVVTAHTIIESIVARGFGLDESMLAVVLDPDPALRRGFWRHFDATPDARTIASRLLEEGALAQPA